MAIELLNFRMFEKKDRQFSVVLFCSQDTLKNRYRELENLGNRGNVKLVVQPAPFEVIEFLYQMGEKLGGDLLSIEKDVFWQGYELLPDLPEQTISEFSDLQYQRLLAILEQDIERTKRLHDSFSRYAGYLKNTIERVQ